jgi:hypothetical protein
LADALTANADDLETDLEWFSRVLAARLASHFRSSDGDRVAPLDIAPPVLRPTHSEYARFVCENRLPPSVRLVVLLALIPHVRPQLLDVLWSRNDATQRGFTEFGGMQGLTHGGFIPTGETAVFLLAGTDLDARFSMSRMFDAGAFFASDHVVRLSAVPPHEPPLSGALALSQELVHRFTIGAELKPAFGADFPARPIHTTLDWEHLVLPDTTLEQLEELKRWIRHGGALLDDWSMRDKLRPGFVSLFHGAPGTGKTLSASLIGKHCGCEVYKLDLSMIVSKYIGDTEKNLARVFDQAEHKRWILFFDEADALFGSRTRIGDARDRYANQEVSFLLQRVEDFSGVVILASNLKANIDDAFMRRFQSVVYFPMPGPRERLRIWRDAFSSKARLEPEIDLAALAERFELSGGTIMNVVRYASLMALARGADVILNDDLAAGIRQELLKEGRAL